MKLSRIYTFNSVDADYFRFLNACLASTAASTASISVIPEQEYRTASRRRGLAKFGLRIRMYGYYPVKAGIIAFFAPAHAVLIVTSSAFYLPLVIALIGKARGYKTVHLVYDLYPDALEVARISKCNGVMSRMLGFIAKLTPRWCDSSVYLGQVLKRHAEYRWSPSRCSDAIHIGVDTTAFKEPLSAGDGSVVFHYGGQLGHMHDGDTLARCIFTSLATTVGVKPRFNFMVSGSGATRLRASLERFSTEIGDAVPASIWRDRIRSFQVGLVSLSPGGATVCIPSKTYAMMAGGLAILAICPLWSDLAELVLSNNAGWVVNNSPYRHMNELQGEAYLTRSRELRPIEAIASEFSVVVANILAEPHDLSRRRANARTAAITKYAFESTVIAWQRHLQRVNGGG